MSCSIDIVTCCCLFESPSGPSTVQCKVVSTACAEVVTITDTTIAPTSLRTAAMRCLSMLLMRRVCRCSHSAVEPPARGFNSNVTCNLPRHRTSWNGVSLVAFSWRLTLPGPWAGPWAFTRNGGGSHEDNRIAEHAWTLALSAHDIRPG